MREKLIADLPVAFPGCAADGLYFSLIVSPGQDRRGSWTDDDFDTAHCGGRCSPSDLSDAAVVSLGARLMGLLYAFPRAHVCAAPIFLG